MYPSKCCMTRLYFVRLCIFYTFSKGHIYFIIKNEKLKTLQVRKSFQTDASSISAWKIKSIWVLQLFEPNWRQVWLVSRLVWTVTPGLLSLQSAGILSTLGRNVIWCIHCGEQFAGSLKKKKKIEVSYDLVIPHLGTYPDKALFVYSKRYTHPNVHSSCVYNSQDMLTT